MILRLVLLAGGLAVAVLGAEIGLRIAHGKLFSFADLRPVPWGFPPESFAEYDSLLGWVPRVEFRHRWRGGWSASSDEYRLRRNGPPGTGPGVVVSPVLAVGDSSAFGDEVDDHETWEAHLERRLGLRVLNAGMGGYGIDQAMLRAERLLPRFQPSVVVLSIFSDDVTRGAFSFINRWKPYFTLQNGALVLTPPPPPEVPLNESWWLVALGHSHLARFVMERAFPAVWRRSTHRRVHHHEHELAGRLLARLRRSAEDHGAKLLVVFIVGGNGDMPHFPDLHARARAEGVEVLDLSEELFRWSADPERRERMFRPHYHLSAEGNAWVAEQIARRLSELGWVEGAGGSGAES